VRSLALVQPEFKNLSIAELNEKLIELGRARLEEVVAGADPGVPTIVVGHAHLFGARIGSERLLTMGSDPMYEATTFDLPGVDYVALGHIHKHQVLHYASPPVVYAGSIDRIDFGEEDEEKGWVLVDLPEKGHAEWEFRKVAARPFLTIDARVESDNATEDVVRAIARCGERVDDAVVKLRIDVAPERAVELREDDIRAHLKSAYYIAPIERTSQQRARNRWGTTDAAIQQAGPLEALAVYLEHQNVDAQRRDVLLRHARGLIGEGDCSHAELTAESA
jgi:exonuclease SbcD